MSRLPLFPLQLVLFPNVPLPLHIFEERYRAMIATCIDEGRPFGVVYHRGESIRHVGCTAIIERVLKRYDDGRMDILAVGHERFAIDELDESGLYLEADVHFLEDDVEGDSDDLHQRAVAELLKYAFYAEIQLDRDTLSALTGNQLSFLIAGIDLFGMDTKQELLEIERIEERLERATEELARVNNRLAAASQIKRSLGHDVDINSFLN